MSDESNDRVQHHAKPDPSAKRHRRSIYIEDKAYAAVNELAGESGRSTNAEICFAIGRHLDEHAPGWRD